MRILVEVKPFTIDIPEERGEIYRRLRSALDRAEAIANSRRVDARVKLEALRLIAYIGQVILSALRDVEVEEIERELEELEEKVKNVKG